MAYGSVLKDVVKSSVSGPVTFQNTSGTEIGTLCRAWVSFNGVTTATILASFNVSSITRNSTGNYTINFTNAMPDINYAVSSIGGNVQAAGPALGVAFPHFSGTTYVAPTVNAFRATTQNFGASAQESVQVAFAVFR